MNGFRSVSRRRYRQGIRQSHLGYAAALSVMLLVLAIAGAFLTNRANSKGA